MSEKGTGVNSGVFEPVRLEARGLAVHLFVQPAINLALVHNRVPVVRQLVIENLGSEAAEQLEVRLDIEGPAGPLSQPWQVVVPRVLPGIPVGWDDFASLNPDIGVLRSANEAFPVDYRLNVARHGHPDLVARIPSLALAHDEWFNNPLLFDSLAAFVQPNMAAVDAILRSAAQILVATTGSGSIDGYQSGMGRAAYIAGAVYEALRQAGIHCRDLPASFENSGQKIRTTAVVLDGRLGNCIDLSVTYAACLEQAGLRPLIWLFKGHAIAGFLASEHHLPTTVMAEENFLISMVESGRAVPVELTAVGPGATSLDFPAAVQAGVGHFRDGRSRVLGAVDIHQAHRNGVRPLPAQDPMPPPHVPHADSASRTRPSIDLPPGAARAWAEEHTADEAVPEERDYSPLRIQQWKRSLLDLSLRNPLLSLPARGKGLDLHVPAGALALLDDIIHAGKRLEIVPQDQISHLEELARARRAAHLDPEVITRQLRDDRRIFGAVDEKRYRTVMRGLQRDARTMEQETGGNYLYLTIGTMVHPKARGGEAHAPLFLLPVRIEGGTGRLAYNLVIDGSQIASANQCLVEWLRVRHGVQIAELERPIRDEFGLDIPRTLTAIREHLVRNRLNYRVDEIASLRLLQFSTVQLWRDMRDHWPVFMASPVVRHLVESTGATFDDPLGDPAEVIVDESRLHLPIPADGSQMRAIVTAERGYSFVLEGPPGTGKSQTITNLIATAITSGRSVLFVAEKQAALEVVKSRLTSIGLAPFTLDLHGRTQSMNAIREQLHQSLEQTDRGDNTAWTAVEGGYRAKLAALARYPERIHTRNGAGLTAWSAFESVLVYGDGATAMVPPGFLEVPVADREKVERDLQDFAAVAQSAQLRRHHPWALSGSRTVDSLDRATLHAIANELEKVRAEVASRPELTACLRRLSEPGSLTAFQPAARLAAVGQLPSYAATRRACEPGWDDQVAALRTALAQFRRDHDDELREFQLGRFSVPELTEWLAEAHSAAKRFLGKRKALQRVADRLAPFTHPGVAVDADQIAQVITRLLLMLDRLDFLRTHAEGLGGLRLPPGWPAEVYQAEAQLSVAHQAVVTGRALLLEHPDVWNVLAAGSGPDAAHLFHHVLTNWTAWQTALHSGHADFALWAGELGWFESWQRDGATWQSDLGRDGLLAPHRWAAVLVNTDSLTHTGLGVFREQLLRAEIPADAAEHAYRRGVAVTALAERLRAGDLEYFDPDVHDNEITQFQKAAAKLRAVLPEHLPSMLVERRPFQPGERRGRVAELATELRRKRGGRSFRELFTEYSDVVLSLTPCVLVSPASAATFLAPAAARFDIVIFDEASQITVPEAIGAMGRGRSVVIVGDSRQMPPTSITQASGADDDHTAEEDLVPEDLDSILSEAVESGLPQRWLSWHYRSHDESLIAFSNRYYYGSKLSSMPSPGAAKTAGVHWRRVHGRYERGGRRTNEVEAREIVAEISRRLRAPTTQASSIGVVTFNLPQRDLILNMLEESTDPLIRDMMSDSRREPIFVKNLENVQGDERDVILFSLAFSTDPETGRLPLNLGPLSRAGGERRFNVAITRARRQVVLFASFDPADIDLARTSSVGTQHLRAYCEMAAAGVESLGDLSTTRRHNRDRIREEVAAALEERGFEVTTCHGLSDFTVDIAVRAAGAARWQVAVMLDSPQWGRRPTVADRDDAPGLLSAIMGWPEVVRFWLPAWIRDRSQVLDAIGGAVDRAAAESLPRMEEAPSAIESQDSPPIDVEAFPPTTGEHFAVEAPLPDEVGSQSDPLLQSWGEEPSVMPVISGSGWSDFVPYSPTPLGQRGDVDLIDSSPAIRAAVRAAIDQVIAAEGPVEQQRLARLVLARFGFTKAHADRRAAILALADPELFRSSKAGVFAWPPELDAQSWRGYRRTVQSTDRAIEDIAPEEIANAAYSALAARAGMGESDLLRSTLELLGYRRMTEKIDRLLRYGLEVGQVTGALIREDDGSYHVEA
ncbi:DUF4011 domain-containing protein [Actinoplanes hulinensis]|uniref:DUF4011 domain-containing protein n=1 Tax=Actinoplanes hulinensis TaxID=1144547 RepID=A0ABS7BEG2_9ACTN|nr:DUF4011 domain-containing protein [Actinoplanes hulinensis]MBW6439258.1 DUF4011 domain-containing protein [Actinoplanes hulinensis]MBW6439269.1 DUF4011 domain-containing protein [Actinoplanes hulinensis]